MKVMINAFSARLGGGQTYLVNLLQYIPEKADIEIIVAVPESLKLPEGCGRISRLHTKWPVGNPFFRALWEQIVLPRQLRKLEIDVLFSPGGLVGARVLAGCKIVTMFRNMLPFDLQQRQKYPLGYMRVRNWILQRLMLRHMLKAHFVIFVSEYAKHVVEEYAKRRLRNTAVIPHGINPQFRVVPEEHDARPDWLPTENYLLYVSILDVYKAQIEVVQGYSLLKESRPDIEKLVLIGPDFTEYAQRVRQEIERLGLTHDILVLGEVPYEELAVAYHHAKVNIFASECENCPNILLEALAAGRPLLVSHCQPMPEFGGDAVVYYNPTSPRDFADKLDSFLDDHVRLKALADMARERSLRYNWQQTATRTWNIILQSNG